MVIKVRDFPPDHPIFSEPPRSFSHTSVLNWLASKPAVPNWRAPASGLRQTKESVLEFPRLNTLAHQSPSHDQPIHCRNQRKPETLLLGRQSGTDHRCRQKRVPSVRILPLALLFLRNKSRTRKLAWTMNTKSIPMNRPCITSRNNNPFETSRSGAYIQTQVSKLTLD